MFILSQWVDLHPIKHGYIFTVGNGVGRSYWHSENKLSNERSCANSRNESVGWREGEEESFVQPQFNPGLKHESSNTLAFNQARQGFYFLLLRK